MHDSNIVHAYCTGQGVVTPIDHVHWMDFHDVSPGNTAAHIYTPGPEEEDGTREQVFGFSLDDRSDPATRMVGCCLLFSPRVCVSVSRVDQQVTWPGVHVTSSENIASPFGIPVFFQAKRELY
jgi:hypothetical protein